MERLLSKAKKKTHHFNKKAVLAGRFFPKDCLGIKARKCSLDSILGFRAPSLVTLDISDNKITDIESVDFPATLRILKVNKNQISSIDHLELPDELVELGLSDNWIRHICGFHIPRQLRRFYLANNGLRTLEELDFPPQTEVDISTRRWYPPYFHIKDCRYHSGMMHSPSGWNDFDSSYAHDVTRYTRYEGWVEDLDENLSDRTYLGHVRQTRANLIFTAVTQWLPVKEHGIIPLGAWVARVSYLLGGEVYQRIDEL